MLIFWNGGTSILFLLAKTGSMFDRTETGFERLWIWSLEFISLNIYHKLIEV
jgi:hypothetical protein